MTVQELRPGAGEPAGRTGVPRPTMDEAEVRKAFPEGYGQAQSQQERHPEQDRPRPNPMRQVSV